jgi:hypothetical protein
MRPVDEAIQQKLTGTEMKFLDINLTKDSSLLLHAIHSPFYWRILQETLLYCGLKIHTKKYAKQESSSLRRLESMPRNLD